MNLPSPIVEGYNSHSRITSSIYWLGLTSTNFVAMEEIKWPNKQFHYHHNKVRVTESNTQSTKLITNALRQAKPTTKDKAAKTKEINFILHAPMNFSTRQIRVEEKKCKVQSSHFPYCGGRHQEKPHFVFY